MSSELVASSLDSPAVLMLTASIPVLAGVVLRSLGGALTRLLVALTKEG